MSKYKLSPWHDGSVKPINPGFYQVKSWDDFYSGFITGPLGRSKEFDAWRVWDGKTWLWINYDGTMQTAAINPSDKWRGILE